MSYTIVRLEESRLADLQKLYFLSFGVRINLKDTLKKYDTRYTDKQYIGFLAYDEQGYPAAYYGVFPCFLLNEKGEKVLAAQSGDTMTAPEHQGKGLFVQLAKKTFDLAKEEGISFIFGFPNQNSYPGFTRKLGWTDQENLFLYTLKIKTFPLSKASGRIKKLAPIAGFFAKTAFIDLITDSTFTTSSVLTKEFGGSLRDLHYFNYKKSPNTHVLDVLDVKIWCKLDTRLWIGDMELCDEDKLRKILQRLRVRCFFAGISEIVFMYPHNSYYAKLLPSMGATEKIWLPYCWLSFDDKIQAEKIRLTGADADTF